MYSKRAQYSLRSKNNFDDASFGDGRGRVPPRRTVLEDKYYKRQVSLFCTLRRGLFSISWRLVDQSQDDAEKSRYAEWIYVDKRLDYKKELRRGSIGTQYITRCSTCKLMDRLLSVIGSVAFRRWTFLLFVSITLVYLTGGVSLRSWELSSSVSGKFPSLSLVTREKPKQDLDSISSSVDAAAEELFPSNGLTKDVQWDQFSLIVKGQRIFLQFVLFSCRMIHHAEHITAPESSTHSACPFRPFGLTFFRK